MNAVALVGPRIGCLDPEKIGAITAAAIEQVMP